MNTDGRTTDFRPKTTDVRPKTIDFRPKTTDFRPKTTDFRPKTACLRGAGGTLARSVLTLLLLLAGGMAGGAWATNYNYTYIIINRSNKEAIRYTTSQTAGDPVDMPKYLKSPMTLTYHYYDSSSFTDDGSGNYTQNTLTPISTLPSSVATIYVTYDDYTGSEFDLSRGKQYNISWLGTDGSTHHYLYPYAINNASNSSEYMAFWQDGNSNISSRSLTNSHHLYELYSANNDPYDIKIYNYGYALSSNNHYICFSSSDDRVLIWGKDNAENASFFYSFALLQAYDSSDAEETGQYIVMGTNSYHIDSSNHRFIVLQNKSQGADNAQRAYLNNGDLLNYLFKNGNDNSDKRRVCIAALSTLTYTVVDASGNELASYTEPSGYSSGASATISIPSSLKRDAYCSGYTINSAADGTGTAYNEGGTVTMDADKTLYIRYTTNSAWATLTNGTYYLWKPDGTNYAYATDATYANNGSTATRSTDDAYGWAFSGNPYSVTVTNKQYAANTTTIATTSSDAAFVTEAMISAVTARFHVINKSGAEALRYDMKSQTPGSSISVPDAIKSPYANTYTMYGGYSSGFTGSAISEVPADSDSDGISDIYVDYTVDTSALATDGIDLSGTTDYNLLLSTDNYYLMEGTSATDRFRPTASTTKGDNPQWTLNASSNDPYDVKIRNSNASGFYWAQATSDYSSGYQTYMYSDSYSGGDAAAFTSFILLRHSSYTSAEPYFELRAATGNSDIRYAGISSTSLLISPDVTANQRRLKLRDASLPDDVTGYDKITISIPASAYNSSAGSPYMPAVKYNKTFPLVITSDDMGLTELSNNWAFFNGYPTVSDWRDISLVPRGDSYLNVPYEPAYTSIFDKSVDVSAYTPLTYSDGTGVNRRFTATSAIMPSFLTDNDNAVNYTKINAAAAKTMLRTGWSFAQHDVESTGTASSIAALMESESDRWAQKVGIGLKVLVEPNGNHTYLDAAQLTDGMAWSIFQNSTDTYPAQSKAISDWTNSRTDWSAAGVRNVPTRFSSKPTGAYLRTFFQGNETTWKNEVEAADGTNIVIGGTHGIGSDIRNWLKTTVQPADRAWVASADEVWEYYHIYNTVKISTPTYSDGKVTFDVYVPRYKKHQFRELTINVPGLTGGPDNSGTVEFSGDATVYTGSYKQNSSYYTLNFGLEDITGYIDELKTIYDANPANEFVKRDAQYLVSLLLPGSSARTTYASSSIGTASPYTYSVQTKIGDTPKTTLISGSASGSTSLKYVYPRYILDGGTLYEKTANATNPHYGGTLSISGNTAEYVTYSAKSITGTPVFFAEGERLLDESLWKTQLYTHTDPTYTGSIQGFAAGMGSGGAGANIGSSTPLAVTTLGPGTYKVTIALLESNYTQNSSDNQFSVNVGGESKMTVTTAANSTETTEYTSNEFTVAAANTPVTISHNQSAGGSRCLDYVYIVRTAAAAPTVTITASPTSGVKVGDNITLTATATLNGNSSLSNVVFQYSTDGGDNWTTAATVTEGLSSGVAVNHTFTPAAAGTYIFRATATDNGSLIGTSEETSAVTVTAAPALSTVTLSSSSSNPVAGTTVTLTATATPVSGYTVTRLVIEKKTGTDTWEEVGDAYTASASSRGSTVRRASSVDPSTGEVTVTYDFTAGAVGTGYEFRANATFSDGNTPTTVRSTDAVASGGENHSLQLTSSLPEPALDNYTLHIIDNNGNDVFGGLSVTKQQIIDNNGDPLLAVYPQYCSPFVSQYLYFDTSDKAQANSGSATTWSNTDVYVGYTVDATKMAAGKVHAIWANNQYMHALQNAKNSHSDPLSAFQWWNVQNQDVDNDNATYSTGHYIKHTNITPSTLPIVDNTYMWDLGTDPYHIKLKNAALGLYATSTASSTRSFKTSSSEAETYCLLYWQGKTGSDNSGNLSEPETTASYYRLVRQTAPEYTMMAWSNQWGEDNTGKVSDWNNRSKVYIQELPAVNINIVDSLGNVECTLQGYFKSDATMPSDGTDGGTSYYTPYNLYRSYTSKHKWYYDAAGRQPVANGQELNSNLTSNPNIYVRYCLNSDWGKDAVFHLYPDGAGTAYWYAVRFDPSYDANKHFLAAPTTITDNIPKQVNANGDYDSNHKEYYWALKGTPYNLKLINMYHGDGYYLGARKSGLSSGQLLYLLEESDANVTSWEMVDGLTSNKNNEYSYLRLQKSFNGEYEQTITPLYLSNNDNNNPVKLLNKANGTEQVGFIYKTTTDVTPSAATLTLAAGNASPEVDETTTLTATATPADNDTNPIKYFAIEQETGTDVWEEVGTAYAATASSRGNGPRKANSASVSTTGVVTVTYDFTPDAAVTYNFRARAVMNDNTGILSTATASEGGTGSVLAVTASLATINVPSTVASYTLKLIDKSGNEVFSESGVPTTRVTSASSSGRNGDPLANKYRSPFVKRYRYYSDKTEAQNDSGSSLFDWETEDGTTPIVYVGYEVDATKMAAAKEYAIASNVSKHYMHVNFRADQAHTDNAWWLQNQDLDVSNGSGSSVNIDNLPFVDDNYMWILGSDPYNVTLKNKKHGKYSQPVSTGATAGWDASAGTAIYSLVYWNGQTTGTDYALRWRDALPSASEYYVMSNTTYNDWRLTATASADNAKLLVKELPDLNVKVVDASGTVEYTLHAHYLNTATMCQNLPYCLRRSYTTGHKFYYEQLGINEITTGQLFDQTKFDGQNIYMKYSLESGWTEINQSNGWYALHFGKPTESKYLYVNDNKEVKGTSTSTQQSAHWHITGTPYAVKFMSRSNDGYYMGYTLASTSNDVVRVYNDNSALTTWELRTISQSGVDNSIKSCPVIHPQDAFSGEPPFLYLRHEGSKAFLGRDDNSCRVTFEDAMKVELVIVDKRGREVISEYTSIANITGTSGDPLSNTMRSPYAKNYHYYATLAEARDNSGTALDQASLTAKGGSKVYVGYDIITQSNATGSDSIMKIDGSTPYRIRRNNNNTQAMHAVFAPSLTYSPDNNYGWKMDNQTKDDRDGSNTVNYNTLPFIDRSWAWELVSDNGDPYNVKFRNKATGQYLRCEDNSVAGYRAVFTSDANAAAVYSLLRFGDSATGNYIAIYVDAPIGESRTQGYLYYNSSDGGTWRLQTTRSDARFRIEELTEPLDIHIVAPTGTSHAGEVEATIHGYRNSDVGATTMPNFVPYFLTRAYTSDQKFYYTQAEAAAATSGTEITTVTDASITDSYGSDGVKDIFVSYTLDDTNWISSGTTLSAGDKTAGTTIIKPFYSSEKKINWYGIRTNENASYYLKATTAELPAVIGRTTIDKESPDYSPDDADMKRSEWAIIGTPYSMQLVERQHGMASHLGVAADSARAYVYEGGTAGVVTTFELVTGLNRTTGKLFLRPQGSLNGQTPYVYIGGNSDDMPLSRGAASAQIIDLTWITETDAKTVTFTLYDRDGNSMSSTVSGYTFYGVSQGDSLNDLFEAAGMKRRYCEYTFYNDAALTNVVNTVGTGDEETIRAKWDYTDDAPVFNEDVLDARDYQYYMIGVGSGSVYFLMDVEEDEGTYTFKPNDGVVTPRDQDHQFAIVGNPYSFYLYNRGAAKNIRRKASLDLTFDDTEEVEGVATPTEELEFDMPIVSTLTYSSTECSFRSKKSGRFLTASSSAFSMTQTYSPTQKTRFRYIIVPVRVFKEGATTLNDQKDYRMYGLEMNPDVSGTATARTTSDRITTDYLRASGNAVGMARDYRHAFCDYTYYRSYDWHGNLTNPIPEEGLSYYGGKGQYKKQFFATYTVDEQAFSRLYYMNANNREANSTWQDAYIGKGSSSTNGYTLTASREFESQVKTDENNTYRWFFTGDPYDMQIHCVGVGDLNSDCALASRNGRINSEYTGIAPSQENGQEAVLTADLKEGDTDTESYGQLSHFEIIQRSTGYYVLWSIDTDNRYDYCLTNYFKSYNGVKHLVKAESSDMSALEWMLVDVFNHYTVTWHVMEYQGTEATPSYADVASKDVVYDENTVLQVQDLPEELRRHFCLYSEMYSDNGCTDAIANNALTVTASTSIYVPYTLDSGAPDFLPEAPTAEPAEKYWYEIHYPGPEELVYYKTADGTVSHDLLNSSHTIDNVRNLGDSYTPYRWALIGTPYSVKFYNKQTSSYLNTDGSTLSMSASGTTFTLYDDYTGNLCAIYDAVTGKYLNATAGLQTYNGNEGTAVDFTNTYGVVKIAFVLHYSKNTLRQRDSNDDDVLDTTAANTTETIRIDSYQKMDKALDDVLPTVWKRAFCKYTYHWDTSTTEDTNTDTEVETVSESMVNAYNANKENYLYVHVTYDYEIDSPFKWSTADATWENKHWYYLVNNHIQGSERGKMVYRDSGPKLRVSTGLVDGRQYLYNFEWCVIGDPYGFKMLNHYDPDELFSQYISVTDVNDSANEGKQIEQQSGNTKCLFEMMPGRYSYNFWMHPIYDYTLMGNEYNNNTYTYVGHNYNGSAAIIPANRFNMTYLKSNTAANLRLEIRTDATLKEYLDYAGFVGSIKTSVVPDGLAEKITNGTATDEKLKALHDSIDNPTNLVQMQQGYYRIIPYVYEKGKIDGEAAHRRYVRGYHYGHGTEGYTDEQETTTEYSYHDRFEYEAADNSHNKRLMANELPALAEYDPASIFHFEATTENGHPRYLVTTQGLNLSGHSLSTADAFKARYENIGAVTCQLKTVVGDPTNDANHLYLSWQQNAGGNEPDDYRRMELRNCFEMYGFTRLYLQPVGSGSAEMPLKLEMYPGQHTPEGSDTPLDYYFASIYVPYDLVLPDGEVYAYAGKLTKNNGKGGEKDWRLQCEKLSEQTIGGVTYEKGKFISAGTPALIRATATEVTANTDGLVTDYDYDHANTASGFITLTIPNDIPATADDDGLVAETGNIFKGQYLEQVLSASSEGGLPDTSDDDSNKHEVVYVFGQATVNEDNGEEKAYETIPDDENRTLTDNSHPKLEAGFYINKNTVNGSADYSKKNNLYVRHNKIYLFEKTVEESYPSSSHYSGGGGGSARQFIALDFGETGIEEQSSGWQTVASEGVYDMQGRRVASAEKAADGSWRKGVKSGVYIENGRKVVVK